MSAKKSDKKVSFIDYDVNGDKLEITPDAAKEATKDYYLNSVAKHINLFLEGTTNEVEEKMSSMQKDLTSIIEKKMDAMAEKIVEEILKHRITEQVENKVAEKLSKRVASVK